MAEEEESGGFLDGLGDTISSITGIGGSEDENGDGTGEGTDETGSDDSSSSSSSTVKKIPITDPKKAREFALREWNKIKRTSGHTLETQVFGSNHWQVGEWCKIYIPSMNEYIDMYITKIDNSSDSGSEWTTSITLSDYAPSLSSVDESETEEETSDGTGETGDGTDESSDSEIYTKVSTILHKYLESNDWNSYTNSVRKCTTRDCVKKLIVGHKKKEGVKDDYRVVITEICEALKIED